MPNSCYISAPFGLDLGELPSLLSSRVISWDWANESAKASNSSQAIRNADFFIGILNRTRADYRVVHEAGIAAGLDKQILLLTTPSLKLPIDLSLYSIARVSLSDKKALAFHLDAFLATPMQSIFEDRDADGQQMLDPPGLPSKKTNRVGILETDIERQLCEVFERSGVSFVAEPVLNNDKRYRPDILVWLGSQDAELLDPAVIEVKRRVERNEMHLVEQQLLGFMSAAGAKTGIIVTEEPAPVRKQHGWPNVYWLDLATISRLVDSAQLGSYLRDARNRAAHGRL